MALKDTFIHSFEDFEVSHSNHCNLGWSVIPSFFFGNKQSALAHFHRLKLICPKQRLTFGRSRGPGGCAKQEHNQGQHCVSSAARRAESDQEESSQQRSGAAPRGPSGRQISARLLLMCFIGGEGRLQTPRSSTKYEITCKSLTGATRV